MHFRNILLFCCLLINSHIVFSQVQSIVSNEKLLKQYLEQSVFEIDSSAIAIVLYDRCDFDFNNQTLLAKSYHERTIKILNKSALDLATVSIPLTQLVNIRKIKAFTYNNENGQMVQQKIEKEDVIGEKLIDEIEIYKFTFPQVKEGSIIHYSYVIEYSDMEIPSEWYYQSDYPCLNSIYSINIPEVIKYTAVERSSVSTTIVKKEKELEACESCSYKVEFPGRYVYQVWARKNIPAFKNEPYSYASNNYKDRIKFHYKAFADDNGKYIPINDNWASVNKRYYAPDTDYRQAYNSNSFLKKTIEDVTDKQLPDLDNAKAIFKFVRDSIQLRTGYKKSSANQLKYILEHREAGYYGTNILLTALLRKAGFNSYLVLLATKENEMLNAVYPDPGNINYVVSLLKMDGKEYFLDATDKFMPFGRLPYECYNGFSWVLNETGVEINLAPENVQSGFVGIYSLYPDSEDSAKLQLKAEYMADDYMSVTLRQRMNEDSMYLKKYYQKLLDANAEFSYDDISLSIDNLMDIDKNLKIQVLTTMNLSDDIIYMNPYFHKFFESNPFKDAERSLPIIMDHKYNYNYVFNFKLPKGYILDEYPESAIYQLSDEKIIELTNLVNYDQNLNELNIRCKFKLNSIELPIDEYEAIKAIFAQVIEEQNKNVVIKRVKN